MTKLELIQILNQFPDDAEIRVPLYNGSLISHIEPTQITFDEETETILLEI